MDIEFPKQDECLEAAQSSPQVLNFLAQRRSGLARAMTIPGPNPTQRDHILKLAARVPDHRKLSPWRFLVFEGDVRAQFGEILAHIFQDKNSEMPQERIEHERDRFMRAPLVVAVISSPKKCPRQTPKWEQELSAGAVCFSMLLAARANGFSAQWISEWYAYDPTVKREMGLSSDEKIAGIIYIGTPTESPMERQRPDMYAITAPWTPFLVNKDER